MDRFVKFMYLVSACLIIWGFAAFFWHLANPQKIISSVPEVMIGQERDWLARAWAAAKEGWMAPIGLILGAITGAAAKDHG